MARRSATLPHCRAVAAGSRATEIEVMEFQKIVDDIAATLGLARGAVGTTLSRARRKLVEAYRAGEETRDVAS